MTGPSWSSGGTGVFGLRLVRGLVATTDLDVIVAARDLRRTRVLVEEINVAQSRCGNPAGARCVAAIIRQILAQVSSPSRSPCPSIRWAYFATSSSVSSPYASIITQDIEVRGHHVL